MISRALIVPQYRGRARRPRSGCAPGAAGRLVGTGWCNVCASPHEVGPSLPSRRNRGRLSTLTNVSWTRSSASCGIRRAPRPPGTAGRCSLTGLRIEHPRPGSAGGAAPGRRRLIGAGAGPSRRHGGRPPMIEAHALMEPAPRAPLRRPFGARPSPAAAQRGLAVVRLNRPPDAVPARRRMSPADVRAAADSRSPSRRRPPPRTPRLVSVREDERRHRCSLPDAADHGIRRFPDSHPGFRTPLRSAAVSRLAGRGAAVDDHIERIGDVPLVRRASPAGPARRSRPDRCAATARPV